MLLCQRRSRTSRLDGVCKTNRTECENATWTHTLRVKIQKTHVRLNYCFRFVLGRNDVRTRVTEWFLGDERSSRADDSITTRPYYFGQWRPRVHVEPSWTIRFGQYRNRTRFLRSRPIGEDVQTIRVLSAYNFTRPYRRKVSAKFVRLEREKKKHESNAFASCALRRILWRQTCWSRHVYLFVVFDSSWKNIELETKYIIVCAEGSSKHVHTIR